MERLFATYLIETSHPVERAAGTLIHVSFFNMMMDIVKIMLVPII